MLDDVHGRGCDAIADLGDIDIDTISFLPSDAKKARGVQQWITRRQGWLFFPLLTRLFSLGRLMQWLAIASVVIMALYIPVNSYTLLFAITFAFNLVYPNLLPAIESGATVLMQTEE